MTSFFEFMLNLSMASIASMFGLTNEWLSLAQSGCDLSADPEVGQLDFCGLRQQNIGALVITNIVESRYFEIILFHSRLGFLSIIKKNAPKSKAICISRQKRVKKTKMRSLRSRELSRELVPIIPFQNHIIPYPPPPIHYLKWNFPMNWSVRRLICHNFLKGREVTLPCFLN